MRGDYRQNYKFSYAVLTWCFRLRKCCYALLIWHCKVQCRTFAFSYVFLNSVMFFCIVLCSSVLDYVLLRCIMLCCIGFCSSFHCFKKVCFLSENGLLGFLKFTDLYEYGCHSD